MRKTDNRMNMGEPEVRELKLGASFTNPAPRTVYHTLKYDFKPASVDVNKTATLEVSTNKQVTVTVPHLDGSGVPNTVFKGNQRDYSKKECVLIYDKITGEYTLERLHSNVQVKKTRTENKVVQPPPPPPQIKVENSTARQSSKTKITTGSRKNTPISFVPKNSPLQHSPSYPNKSPLAAPAWNANNTQQTLPSIPIIGLDDGNDFMPVPTSSQSHGSGSGHNTSGGSNSSGSSSSMNNHHHHHQLSNNSNSSSNSHNNNSHQHSSMMANSSNSSSSNNISHHNSAVGGGMGGLPVLHGSGIGSSSGSANSLGLGSSNSNNSSGNVGHHNHNPYNNHHGDNNVEINLPTRAHNTSPSDTGFSTGLLSSSSSDSSGSSGSSDSGSESDSSADDSNVMPGKGPARSDTLSTDILTKDLCLSESNSDSD
ncbi:ell-associated factor Eaf isoform X2 [Uranotaenia lowii]|uniref:ell-associated factor Eaf isoform X2 n=1 Tax=Uranotaenia lowii TaxID=190385 RepID=UPI0024798FA8|nr:ell-associated factor Eaf isoform X2 [Uranotaenia lowii]